MDRLTLILLLPLAGFLINGIFGNRFPRWLVSAISCGLPAVSFLLVVNVYQELLATNAAVATTLLNWAAMNGFSVDVALYFDRIAAVMCLVVTGVGTLIHVYSIGYMAHDRSYARFFAYLNLFLFFMLFLVLGKNLLMLFVGWEGVGLASYLLIGFWFEDPEKTAAGVKAFIVNRVGDTGFVLGMFLVYAYAGTLDFQGVNAYFTAQQPSVAVMNAIGLLLLLGACGKSAQIPLQVWLPDAMAGPTPVSALIHAATMVTAGVYMLARLNGVFTHAPDVMTVVAWVGAATALMGATMGITQFNLKKVLAYSTVSQIGFMFMACGLGAFSVGMFHLYTHAFFKACLFLCAGSVIHALHGEEDMRRMGGLAKKMPFTFGTFLLATLALCGLPPFAGFFSKDEILWMAWSSPYGSTGIWLVGSVTSFLTAFYMFRLIFMTYFGASHVPANLEKGIHEPPPSMSIVLAVLAFGSVVAGFIGLPNFWREALGVSAPFYDFLAPAFAHVAEGADHHAELVLMIVAVAVALAGIFVAWLMFSYRPQLAAQARKTLDLAHQVVSRGYFFDAFYYGVVVRFADWLSEAVLARGVERGLDKGVLTKSSDSVDCASGMFSRLQTGNVQAYVLYALAGLVLVLWWGGVHA
jgi:NADH-quinone oxidoreductase subunit L